MRKRHIIFLKGNGGYGTLGFQGMRIGKNKQQYTIYMLIKIMLMLLVVHNCLYYATVNQNGCHK